ncbi:uncharacterized protein LOC106639285 [Copidosoma floridanum]|uniref:uncharacterized protein LOC106639285 n=1 Tax=Copidosoma floridanum TaxID=29053 RepID=UPI0006C99C44|nr:uncharacterized protein LOC106639285 [Copidosoma floridanum]
MPGDCRDAGRLALVVVLLLDLGVGGGRGLAMANSSEESPLQRRMASLSSGHGKPRPEKYSMAEEFNFTGVLQPEYQMRATLKPNDVSQFYYLNPKTGSPPTLLVSPCSGPISWNVSYVGPPKTEQHAEGTKSAQTHYLVKNMIPGSPLFKYEGAETRNFTIPGWAQANLYRIDMRPVSSPILKTRSPNTVLLYATSDALAHLPSNLAAPTRTKRQQPSLEFQQRWSRRRLIVSWNKSYIDADKSTYLLAVTSGEILHPPTLCAAENVLRKHPCPSRPIPGQPIQHRSDPEGLHCVRRTKLTLFGVKYNMTYHFTLYIMNTQTNVSSLVAMDSFRFHRRAPINLQNGRYISANLRDNDGFVVFRYKPRDNTTTIFNILACGACSIKAKFRAPDYCLNSATRNSPWEYRTLRKCRSKRASRCAAVTSGSGSRGIFGTGDYLLHDGDSSRNASRPCKTTRSPAHSLARPCPSP